MQLTCLVEIGVFCLLRTFCILAIIGSRTLLQFRFKTLLLQIQYFSLSHYNVTRPKSKTRVSCISESLPNKSVNLI